MRVRLLRDVSLYWNYAIQRLTQDDEYEGDFARHLADNTPLGTVEVLTPDAPAPSPVTPVAEPAPAAAGDAGPPMDGTIDTLMTWIDGDPNRARAALAAENAKDKPRVTVVNRLTAMTGTD